MVGRRERSRLLAPPDWTSIVPQFLLVVAYSAVFVVFMVWLLGGRLPVGPDEGTPADQLAGA